MVIVDERDATKQSIDSALNLIYNLGDKDECSDKHLGHCLAAISSGQTHRQAVAYATPWNSEWDEEEDIGDGVWDTDVRRISLGKYWQIIQDEFNKIGQTEFHEIVEELQEPYYSDCLVYYFPTGVSTPFDDVAPPPPYEESSPSSEEIPTACPTTTSHILGILMSK
jgi:hypothetical protein